MKRLAFLLLNLVSITSYSQLPSYVPSDSLKCYYMFDDNNNYGKDYSINHNDLSSSAGTHDTDRNGLSDGAFTLGNSGQIVSSYKGVPDRKSRTISTWIYVKDISLDTVEHNFPFYNRRHIIGYSDFRVYLTGDMIEFATSTNCRIIAATIDLTSTYKITANTWHLITATFDGSNGNNARDVVIYIDGNLTANVIVTPYNANEYIGSANDDFTVGSISNDTSLNFRGKVDEIGFWSKALTATEISQLYTGDVTHVPTVKAIDFSIVPNPANSFLNIRSSATIGKIELFDLTGKLVLSQMVTGNKCSLDISTFKAGTYILRANGSFIDKVIKN